MLNLKEKPTLKDFQEYVSQLEVERGFNHQSARDKSLLLGEEMGELFKAIRKAEGMNIDVNSSFGNIADELADMLIYLCSISNRFEIDMEQAFRDKENINKKRVWVKP